ncbi:hypothetical protein [Natronosalvus caseinilyticus]|uniref:hypothetical protein n=1 Tax=Natronosalvus caseinilyticus TaxID=2953747 RepID=UPI0028AC46DC|nr:hypothetical protein [Natronosalvus caseinilyticus]
MDPDAENTDDSTTAGLQLSDAEKDALHDLQLAVEHLHRGYGALLECHHEVGHAMDQVADAEDRLREADHETWANDLRDEYLPAGSIGDRWTYELIEEFSDGFLRELTDFEATVRDELADGQGHVTEREQQRRWRERAEGWKDE